MERDSHLAARGNDEARRTLPQTERLGRRAARQPPTRVPAQALRGHRLPAAEVGCGIGDFAGRRRCVLDAGDPDRRRIQPRLLQGEVRQRPADAQPRHERDVHRDDRALALRVERREREAAPRPGPVRRDLVSGWRRAPVHERHVRRAEQGAPADVHHRRQPAAGRIHAARDAALRGVAAGASRSPRASAASVFTSATATNSVATNSAAAATAFQSTVGWACA
jgi:hypothetical protein